LPQPELQRRLVLVPLVLLAFQQRLWLVLAQRVLAP
jgi:hypothetical protein